MKKILGYLLMVLGGLFVMASLATFPKSLKECYEKCNNRFDGESVGFTLGTIIAEALIILLIVFLIKTGLKLIRNYNKSKYI